MNELERTPPQASDMERAVLGAMMLEENALDTAMMLITEETFYKPVNQAIFRAMKLLWEENSPIDQLSLADKLTDIGMLDSVGGEITIAGIMNEIASAANVEYHCKELLEKESLRRIIVLCTIASNLAYDGKMDSKILLHKTSSKFDEIVNKSRQKKAHPMIDVAHEGIHIISERMESKEGLVGLPTGYMVLDKFIGGWQKADMIIIAARPTMGKTSLMLELSARTAQKGHHVGIFSLETSYRKLGMRMIATRARQSVSNLYSLKDKTEAGAKLNKAASELGKLPIWVDDASEASATEIKAHAKRMVKLYGIEVLMIDYLQLITGIENDSRYKQVTDISRILKSTAKTLDIPIIVVSQLRRPQQGKEHIAPLLSDLRESGCLRGDTTILSHSHRQHKKLNRLDNDKNIGILDSHSNKKGSIMSNAIKCFKTGYKQFYKITLKTGHTIEATEKHKFLSPSGGWMMLKNLTEQSMIGVPLNFKEKWPKVSMSDDEIKMIALFLGNGCAIPSHSLQYTSNTEDADICEEIMILSNRITNDALRPYKIHQIYRKGTARESSSWQVFFPAKRQVSRNYRNPLVKFFERYEMYGKRHKTKEIPPEIFFQNNYSKKLFIKYLWATDGTISIGKVGKKTLAIAYSSSSEVMIRQLQLLLQSIGILSTVYKIKQGKYEWYNLNVYSRYFQSKFLKEIGIAGKRKKKVLDRGLEKLKHMNVGWTQYELSQNRSVVYVPIKKIIKTDIDLAYDIEVENTHNFYANGMIVHNSIEQDSDIIIFIHDPSEEIKRDYLNKYGVAYQEEDLKHKRMIKIAKNRDGMKISTLFNWYGDIFSFEEINTHDAYEAE